MPVLSTPTSATLVRELPGDGLRTLFDSPEFYPVGIGLRKRVMLFVRMSPELYRECVFLDSRTEYLGNRIYSLRLDDVLLEASARKPHPLRIHYIFHPTFCCSTLLARYFELLSNCLVLKEPGMLTQLALVPQKLVNDWKDILHLSSRLLARTYNMNDLTVIKAHEPCNAIAQDLLDCDASATATFMVIPLKQFVVSVLKSKFRRDWVRSRIPAAARAAQCLPLLKIRPDDLTDAQAAAYLWGVNSFLSRQLFSGRHRHRVHCLDGNDLVDFPETSLRAVMAKCGLKLEDMALQRMIEDSSVHRYSKDLSRPYSVAQRQKELAELDSRFGSDARTAVRWLISCGIEPELPIGTARSVST